MKVDRAISTMTWLDLILDNINPLGFLQLDVEGWETYSLCWAEWNFATSTTPASLSVGSGMRWIGRGGILTSRTPINLGLPATTSLPLWQNILIFSGSSILFIRIWISASTSGVGGEYLGEGRWKWCLNHFLVRIMHHNTQEIQKLGKRRQISLLYPQ